MRKPLPDCPLRDGFFCPASQWKFCHSRGDFVIHMRGSDFTDICASRGKFSPKQRQSGFFRYPKLPESFAGGCRAYLSEKEPALKGEFSLPISHFPFPISHFPFPLSHFPLPTSLFPLPTSHFPLPTSHFSLPGRKFLKSNKAFSLSEH